MKEIKAAISVAPKNMTSALGSLMSSYGEDMTESESDKESDGNYVWTFYLVCNCIFSPDSKKTGMLFRKKKWNAMICKSFFNLD